MSLRNHLLRLHRAHRSDAEHAAAEEARMYRNLLALLPYCVPRHVSITAQPGVVVYFRPSRRKPRSERGPA